MYYRLIHIIYSYLYVMIGTISQIIESEDGKCSGSIQNLVWIRGSGSAKVRVADPSECQEPAWYFEPKVMRQEVDGGYVFLSIEKAESAYAFIRIGIQNEYSKRRPGSSVKVAVILPQGVLRLVPVLVVEGRVPAPPPRLVGVVLRLLALPPLLHPRPDRSSARAKTWPPFCLVWLYASCIYVDCICTPFWLLCLQCKICIFPTFLLLCMELLSCTCIRRLNMYAILAHFAYSAKYLKSFKLDRLTSIYRTPYNVRKYFASSTLCTY